MITGPQQVMQQTYPAASCLIISQELITAQQHSAVGCLIQCPGLATCQICDCIFSPILTCLGLHMTTKRSFVLEIQQPNQHRYVNDKPYGHRMLPLTSSDASLVLLTVCTVVNDLVFLLLVLVLSCSCYSVSHAAFTSARKQRLITLTHLAAVILKGYRADLCEVGPTLLIGLT